ncbi:hypothetical protein PNA2_0627 [Pyrococcus sp. NA2]|uniref:hypothetical protein n=1 Tax=Pyrococcus sp. (strain NA2) TaxID=342949 RepID=UPI000209AC39|nr:hypothetical protein [Pyrococcus sp. NA2]AEC51543.1 hypothetical protein PNA2_0627 [Pyrococcus sp. NA2]
MEKSEKLFLALLLGFLGLAIIGKLIIFRESVRVGSLTYSLLFTILFVIGLRVNIEVPMYSWPILSILIVSPLGLTWIAFWLFIVLPLAIYLNRKEIGIVKPTLTVMTTMFSITPELLGIIPIVNPETRYDSVSVLYVLSGYGIALLNSLSPSIIVTAYGIMLGVISMYRSVIALSILPVIYRGKIPWKVLLVSILAIVAISGMRGIDASEILYRPAFTYRVYETLYDIGMPFGSLFIIGEPIPGYKVAHLFGSPNRYTYTIFGEAVADFGVFGILEGLLLGICIKSLRKKKWAHSFALTILTLGIEVGLDAFKLGTLFLLPFVGGENNER